MNEYLDKIEEMMGMAIPSHSTSMNHDEWDGPDNERQMKKDQAYNYYKKAYAFVDKDKSLEKKNAYKFIHHMVDENGKIGAANVKACQTGIGIMNGARGGTTIPDNARKAVYNHLAKHLRDADVEPAPMKEGIDMDVTDNPISSIVEYVEMYVEEDKIDRDAGIIKDVIILAGKSLNNRTYPSEVLKESVSLFEGIRIFIDHPESDKASRSVKDLVGQFKEVYYDSQDDKVKGNFHVLRNFQEWIFSIAESMPDIAGMSINGAGSIKKTQTGDVVEKLVSMKSVDLVVQPATTKSLFEGKEEEIEQKKEQDKGDVDNMVDITLEMLKAEHSDVLKQHEQEITEKLEVSELKDKFDVAAKTISELNSKIEKGEEDAKVAVAKEKDLNEAMSALKLKVEEYELKEKVALKKELVEKLITESELPEKAITPLIRELLMAFETEDKMKAILEDRKAFLASISEGVVDLGAEKNLDEKLKEAEKKVEGDTKDTKKGSEVGAKIAEALGITEEELNKA